MAPRDALTDHDVDRIADALASRLQNHQCRFSDAEAKRVHQLHDSIDQDTLVALAIVGRFARTFGAMAGTLVARVIMVAIFLAIATVTILGGVRVLRHVIP